MRVKGINGALELIGGALVALFPRGHFHRIAEAWAPLEEGNPGFLVFSMLSHGVLKTFIAVTLLRPWRRMAPAAVAVFVALIAYEIFRLVEHPGILIAGIVAVDLLILVLVLRHLRGIFPGMTEA